MQVGRIKVIAILALYAATTTIGHTQSSASTAKQLRQAITSKQNLIVVKSAPNADYVFAAGGAAPAGSKGSLSPAGGSYWAFAASSVLSLDETTVAFSAGARLVIGHVTGTTAIAKVANKLLDVPVEEGGFPTDCFDGICLNGVVGLVGTSLKLLDDKTGRPDKAFNSVKVLDLLLVAPCGARTYWKCVRP